MSESYVVFYTYKEERIVVNTTKKFFNSKHEAETWIQNHKDFWDFDLYKWVRGF